MRWGASIIFSWGSRFHHLSTFSSSVRLPSAIGISRRWNLLFCRKKSHHCNSSHGATDTYQSLCHYPCIRAVDFQFRLERQFVLTFNLVTDQMWAVQCGFSPYISCKFRDLPRHMCPINLCHWVTQSWSPQFPCIEQAMPQLWDPCENTHDHEAHIIFSTWWTTHVEHDICCWSHSLYATWMRSC